MAAPRLFGEQRVPIASWATAHEHEQPYVPGRNRYDDDDFQPAHVDSLDGSSYGELPQGSNYTIDSGREAPESHGPTAAEPIPLTLDALKYLEESSTARESKHKPIETQDSYVGVPHAKLMPADALSMASNGSVSVKSCPDWKAQIIKMYKHKSDFVNSMEAWSARVQNEAPYKLAYYHNPRLMREDTVMDPATGATTQAPEAPRILVDEMESESASMKQCRATQTTNSVCAMKRLKSQQLIELESPVLAMSQAIQVRPASPTIPAVPAIPTSPESPASREVRPQGPTDRVARVAHVDRVDMQAAVAALAPAATAAQEPKTTPTPTSRVPTINKVPAPVLDKGHAPVVYEETQERPESIEKIARVKTPDTRDKDAVNLCDACEDDINAMLKIYNEEVRKGTQTWGGDLATAADFESLLATCHAGGLPLIIAFVARDKKREVVGFAYLSKARAAWRNAIAPVTGPKTVQAHVYVRMRYRGRGIGSMLMSALMGSVSQVARVEENGTGTNETSTDKIEFLTVEVLCGSENGMMEREYERVLTQSFGFHAHPDPCDTMHWSKKTSRWLKTQKYYYACQKASTEGNEDGNTDKAEGDAESVSSTKLLAV